MSQLIIAGDTSGTVTLQAPAVAGTTVLTLPATTGSVALAADIISPIGVGQTWKVLSLANNTNYTNSTSKPIMVNIYLNNGGASQSNVYVDGVLIGANYGNSVGGYSSSTVSAIVPVGSAIKYVLGASATASLAVLD